VGGAEGRVDNGPAAALAPAFGGKARCLASGSARGQRAGVGAEG